MIIIDQDTLLIGFLITSAILSAVVAWVASQKNRSPAAWFLISLLISPIIALLALLIAGPGRTKTGPTTAADLSHLTDDDLATIQAHKARQAAQKAATRTLPKKLE